jgi:uncharacterized C2H2 Zn-finger protein
MGEEQNGNQHFKCPHCACVFLTQADLQKHLSCFGAEKEAHADSYKRTHGRVEHGFG